ncbi:uncharacterized protein LOC112507790 [Cynara cardunculus var. scolymus]|uniref:DUF7780 domain-containing protein n=1 Tax=Cynara cardunculus var. scolymus TaxID=59895 RepID=A0A103YN18_CYNCS|nr:uncharacterized protein LOC112507790 [Cynara cardunculus var. scolymus]KVI12102.1 hypothetical protein Ccrd_009482 [Cynara cardunculus var. scolymus]
MALAGKIKKNGGGAGGGEGWGTGIFLVFFPEEDEQELTSSSSSSPFKFPTINSLLKRTNSSHILTRTQSTISICALLIFLTCLFFTLSTFEPNNNFTPSRRHSNSPRSYTPALQGLGTLYTRGTTAMDNLLLCHVTESVTTKQLKVFLRAFHRSGLPLNSDLLFIFDSALTLESFDNVILEENDIFLKVVCRYQAELCNGSKVLDFPASFNLNQFLKSGKKVVEKGEPIWGWKIKNNNSSLLRCGGGETESTRISYGSVVGFGVGEVDPENSLSGFMDQIPMSLRRWASYPMILGRVRRNFKHVMLVDVKKVLLLGDPLGRVRTKSPESVFLSSTPPRATKHGHKGSEDTHQKTINSAVIMGGVRGIRRLSAVMLTEIVRATTNQQHNKRKNSVTESGLLSRLATNEFALKSIHVSMSIESIPTASSVSESTIRNQTIVWVEHSDYKDIESAIMKHICSFLIDSAVYRDC